MSDPHVISALVRKRAELAGKAIDLDRQKAKLRAEIRHIDHALAIFGYGDPPRKIAPVRPKVYRFKRRELAIFVRELARDGMTLTNREAALRLIAAKGWNADDAELVRAVTESVKSAKNWQNRSERRAGESQSKTPP